MTQQNLAIAQITLLDLNDAIISGTAPLNPVNGTLWIDNSVTPNILKMWNGSAWVTQTLGLSGLDPTQNTNLNNATTALSNMASDSIITQTERILVKSDITDIIGFIPLDTNQATTNFVNKVPASTTANANISKYSGSTSVQSPTGSWTEDTQSYYTNISTQNSTVFTISTGTSSGGIAQALYQFDLIQHVSRTYGYTPTVAWLDNNIKELKLNWFGYASSINGNKVYVDAWNTTSNAKWNAPVNHTSGSIASLAWDSTVNQTNIQNLIDSNGMVYFVSYADAAAAVPNPTTAPTLALSANAGSTLAANTYYVVYTWVTANGETMVSPETSLAVTAGNNLVVTIPAKPFGVTQAKIYMSTATGTETYQGNTTTTTYTQSTVMASGAAKPASNTAVVSSVHNTDYVELVVTTHPIPTTTGMDALGVGSFANARISALNAGILGTDSNYTNLASKYTTLKTYLEGLTPVFPWNVLNSSTITIDPTTWRNNWNNYYLAEYQLQQATTAKLKNNADSISVGGRNLLQQTALFTDDTSMTHWSLNIGSNITGTLVTDTDPIYGGVLHASITVNSATGNNWFVLQNNSLTTPNAKFVTGQTYTLSFLVQNAIPLYVNFMDTNGSNAVTSNYSIPINSSWASIVYTFTANATGNIPNFYLAKADNTLTGDIWVTQIKLETGNRATGWSVAPEEIDDILSDLLSRVGNAELKIDDNSIVGTVTESTTFSQLLDGKADNSDLADFVTSQDLSDATDAINTATDGKIAGIDFTPYVTQSQLTQTSTDWDMQFSTGGGINLLKNSVGFSNTDFWTSTGNVTTTQSLDLALYGSQSGFVLNGGTLSQQIPCQTNMSYTVSVFVKKGSAGTGYLKLYDSTQTIPQNIVSGTTYNYDQITATIAPTETQFTVEINGDSASGGIVFTSMMANIGTSALQWSHSPGEVYNSNVNMDINGVRVSQMNNGIPSGITVMTPTKFAGYSDVNGDGVIDQSTGSPDEVFRMDPDTFVMKSATINPIKIIPITSGGYNGIAFIPSSD